MFRLARSEREFVVQVRGRRPPGSFDAFDKRKRCEDAVDYELRFRDVEERIVMGERALVARLV